MKIETLIKLNSNPNYKKYLREHSYWYKYLNRSDSYFKAFESEMKKAYKITLEDRIEKINNGLTTMSKIMDILN